MPNYAGIEGKKTELIRKALGGSLFIGESSVTAITALTGTDSSLVALPTGMGDGGCMTEEGMRFERAVEQSDVVSFGRYDPSRTDITSDRETLQVDFQETNRRTISLFTGAALSSLVPNATSGELKIVKPERPDPRTYRVLALAVDGPTDAEIYIARYLPRAKVTDFAGQAYSKGDDAIQWGVTFSAEKDTAVGSSVVYFFGGPGWEALLVQMGWTV